MTAFELALKFSLSDSIEGGYVNDPHDPGGATNKGITQRTYDAYRKHNGWPVQSVAVLTADEAKRIYWSSYWLGARCDKMPEKIGLAVFDWFINSEYPALTELQKCLGVTADGVIGPKTLSAIATQDEELLLKRYLGAREVWYEGRPEIVNGKTFKSRFIKGWESRVEQLRAYEAALPTDVPAEASNTPDQPANVG